MSALHFLEHECARRRIHSCCMAWLAAALLASAAQADVDIDINGATRPLEQNIRAFLSLTRYDKRDDLDEDTLTRLAARIPAETRKALQPLGYYEPSVKYDVKRNGKHWKVSIDLTPGRAVRLSEVNVALNGEGQHERALSNILERRALRPGQRLDHGAYEAFKAELQRAAFNAGYLDARWTRNELAIDSVERRAFVNLEMDTGKRYYFGEIAVKQNVIREDRMQRLLRMHPGDPFSLDAVLQTQYVLDDSQYFSQTEVESGERDRENFSVPVSISAQPNKRNHYAASVGYGTDTQSRGKLTWDNRLLNRNGHRSKLELTGSGVGYEATARYIIPVLDIALEKLEFAYTKKKEEFGSDDVISYSDELAAGLTQVLGSWQRVLFTRISKESSHYSDRTVDTFLIIPGVSFATLPTYILGQKQRRYSLYGELSGSPESLGSGASYVRLFIEGERIFDLSERWHLRGRAQLGTTWTDDFARVPLSQRFFAGGDNSVRGFGLNELSPINEADERRGGRHLIVGSIELERDLPRNFRAAVFYDIGKAFDNSGDSPAEIVPPKVPITPVSNPPFEYSAGVGLRYHISVASIGIDVAQPLSEKGRKPRFHLHISTLF